MYTEFTPMHTMLTVSREDRAQHLALGVKLDPFSPEQFQLFIDMLARITPISPEAC